VCRLPIYGEAYVENYGRHLWIGEGHGNLVANHDMDEYLLDMLREIQTQRMDIRR